MIDIQRHVNEIMERMEDRLRMKIDKIDERVANLETSSPTRGSRVNSIGSHDGNEETEAKTLCCGISTGITTF
jgi:hypothetical protein